MKDIIEFIKKNIWVLFVVLLVGFALGRNYSTMSFIYDCKVLGMTRFGDIPVGCRVGEAYK